MTFAQRKGDSVKLDLLEEVHEPTDIDKVDLCCLIMRYHDDEALGMRTCDLASRWGHSPGTLMDECRDIWLAGYRPNSIKLNDETP